MKVIVYVLLVFSLSTTISGLADEIHHYSELEGRFGAYQLGDDTLANEVRNSGISYVIKQYRWSQIEPEQDVFLFDKIDHLLDEVLKPNELSAILLLRTGQNWATDNEYDPELGIPLYELASAPPLYYADYYNFIYTVVDHFRGKVNRFIIENDPLTKYSWYGTPEEFKFLSKVAYRAAKDADPNCLIINNKFPAMVFSHIIAKELYENGFQQAAVEFWNGYNSRREESFQLGSVEDLEAQLSSDFSLWATNFADKIMMQDQAENLDIIGYNYYLHYDYIDEVVNWLNLKMQSEGFNKPLWDLEHGVKDERGEVSDHTAAGELVKGYVITHGLGIDHISWYPFTMDSSSHNFENLKLLYDSENQEFLPPYLALQNLTDHLSTHCSIDTVIPADYKRYAFKSLKKQRVEFEVIWSDSIDNTVNIGFRPSTTHAVVTHFFGSPVETVTNVNDTLVVQVNRSPRFIRWIWDESKR